jgi:exodeoxyribonuclease VII large subunit
MAAHAVVPDRRALEAELAAFSDLAARSLRGRGELGRERLRHVEVSGALAAGLQRAQRNLGHAGERLAWVDPVVRTRACRQRLVACDWVRPMTARLGSGSQRLAAIYGHARSLSPERVIERGFAVVRRAGGTVVRGPEQVKAGDLLEIRVARGTIAATVEQGLSERPDGLKGGDNG